MYLLFDLDGTLTDPAEGITRCLRHALAELAMAAPPVEQLRRYIGPPLRDAFAELCDDPARIEDAVRCYRARFASVGLYENRLYDGIVDCLERSRHAADALFVVTSKPTVYARRIVAHFGLAGYFERVYGSELDGRFGDKAELIGHLLESEALTPARAVMIGDRKFDIAAARRHGVDSIGVLWGYGSRRELAEAGAGRLCSSPAELAAALAA